MGFYGIKELEHRLDKSMELRVGYQADKGLQIASLRRFYQHTFTLAGLPNPFEPWPCS